MTHKDGCLFDFPCSDTFRRYEDELLGRESPERDDGKTWRERRFDDDIKNIRRCREETADQQLMDDTKLHTAKHSDIWKAIRQLNLENEDLRRRFEFEAWKSKPRKKDEKPAEAKQSQRTRVSL